MSSISFPNLKSEAIVSSAGVVAGLATFAICRIAKLRFSKAVVGSVSTGIAFGSLTGMLLRQRDAGSETARSGSSHNSPSSPDPRDDLGGVQREGSREVPANAPNYKEFLHQMAIANDFSPLVGDAPLPISWEGPGGAEGARLALTLSALLQPGSIQESNLKDPKWMLAVQTQARLQQNDLTASDILQIFSTVLDVSGDQENGWPWAPPHLNWNTAAEAHFRDLCGERLGEQERQQVTLVNHLLDVVCVVKPSVDATALARTCLSLGIPVELLVRVFSGNDHKAIEGSCALARYADCLRDQCAVISYDYLWHPLCPEDKRLLIQRLQQRVAQSSDRDIYEALRPFQKMTHQAPDVHWLRPAVLSLSVMQLRVLCLGEDAEGDERRTLFELAARLEDSRAALPSHFDSQVRLAFGSDDELERILEDLLLNRSSTVRFAKLFRLAVTADNVARLVLLLQRLATPGDGQLHPALDLEKRGVFLSLLRSHLSTRAYEALQEFLDPPA